MILIGWFSDLNHESWVFIGCLISHVIISSVGSVTQCAAEPGTVTVNPGLMWKYKRNQSPGQNLLVRVSLCLSDVCSLWRRVTWWKWQAQRPCRNSLYRPIVMLNVSITSYPWCFAVAMMFWFSAYRSWISLWNRGQIQVRLLISTITDSHILSDRTVPDWGIGSRPQEDGSPSPKISAPPARH